MEAARQVPRPGSRAPRHLARAVRLCALSAAALLLGGGASAAAESGPGIALSLPGGGSTFLGGGQISASADVAPRTYTLRAKPGEAGEQVTHGGLSVRGLLGLAGLDPDAVGYLTVPRADGTTAYLPGSDFGDPPPFPEGPALVWVDSNATHFFRPVLGPEDANADENVATPGGEALALGVHDGALLEVSATAMPMKASVGEQVSFSASASGAPAGERLSYRWDFGDGSAAAGAQASHAFGSVGSYEVTATANGSRESGGVSPPLWIVVGNPPTAAGAGAGESPPGAKAAPPRGTSGAGGAGHGGGRATGTTGGGHNSATAADGTGARPHETSGAGSSGSSGPAAVSSSGARAAPGAPARATPARKESISRGAEEQTIRGLLVADTFLEPDQLAATSPASAGGRPSRPAAEQGGGVTLPLAALAAAALCAAGALAEQRGWRVRLS